MIVLHCNTMIQGLYSSKLKAFALRVHTGSVHIFAQCNTGLYSCELALRTAMSGACIPDLYTSHRTPDCSPLVLSLVVIPSMQKVDRDSLQTLRHQNNDDQW